MQVVADRLAHPTAGGTPLHLLLQLLLTWAGPGELPSEWCCPAGHIREGGGQEAEGSVGCRHRHGFQLFLLGSPFRSVLPSLLTQAQCLQLLSLTQPPGTEGLTPRGTLVCRSVILFLVYP